MAVDGLNYFFSNRVCVLTSDKTASHLPITEINPVKSLHSILRKYMTVSIFQSHLNATL